MTSDSSRKAASHPRSKAALILAPLGTLVISLWLYYGYHHLPIHIPKFATIPDQLIFALRWQLPSVGVMFFSVLNIMRLREKHHAANPLRTANAAEELTVWRNFLANTAEQFLINASHHLILSTFLEGQQLKVIPLLTALWVVGRLAYVMGYLNPNDPDRAYRSFGFTLSGLPQPFMFGYCVYRLVTG